MSTSRQRLVARTRVRLTLLIDGGVWGGDATFDQIHTQAAEQAVKLARRILASAVEKNEISRSWVLGNAQVIEVTVLPEGAPSTAAEITHEET